jgi:hypothetical protein
MLRGGRHGVPGTSPEVMSAEGGWPSSPPDHAPPLKPITGYDF